MSLKPLLQELWQRRDCTLSPSFGVPFAELSLPADLEEYFRFCGGAELFQGSPAPLRLGGPMEFVPADPLIHGRVVGSITAAWHVVGRRSGDSFLTVDLDPARLGRVYDSSWDHHGIEGHCPIIARSFTELLQTIVSRGHGAPWWHEPSWPPLGDAFD
ncbi:MAG: SMI1/KNR4 family protein [Thermoanaerobaculia bacterium]